MQLYLVYLCIKFQEKEPNYGEIINENNSSDNTIKRKLNNLKNIFNLKLIMIIILFLLVLSVCF